MSRSAKIAAALVSVAASGGVASANPIRALLCHHHHVQTVSSGPAVVNTTSTTTGRGFGSVPTATGFGAVTLTGGFGTVAHQGFGFVPTTQVTGFGFVPLVPTTATNTNTGGDGSRGFGSTGDTSRGFGGGGNGSGFGAIGDGQLAQAIIAALLGGGGLPGLGGGFRSAPQGLLTPPDSSAALINQKLDTILANQKIIHDAILEKSKETNGKLDAALDQLKAIKTQTDKIK